MNRLHFLSLLILFSLISIGGCKKEKVTKGFTRNTMPCDLSDIIIEVASQDTGWTGFIDHMGVRKYYIVTRPDGQYDTIKYGILCNTPNELKDPKQIVVFSGKYSKNYDDLPVAFPGEVYYNLNLKEYKLVKAD